ncbi:hypothetical protein ABIA35_009709 [Catenulispora sp. MAP12-49]|uniref:hypothetical protein n=1 Tax=Catenulispora sp. MAP12-49 TaxID=3156302 RepID=UPI00351813A1
MDGRWAAIDAATVDVTTQWAMGLGYNKGAPDEVLIGLFDVPRRHDFSLGFLYRRDVPSRVLDAAIGHPDRIVRFLAAEGGNLTPAQWDRLAAATPTEKDRAIVAELRDEVATREPWATKGRGIERPPHPDAAPPASPAEIAEWADAVEDISPDAHSKALWWVAALHDNPDAMRQLAASPKALVRRSVARARHLPPDVVDRLAHDEDRVVHLFLTESCDDATPEVLLSVWSWWPGSLSFPGRPPQPPELPEGPPAPLRRRPEPEPAAARIDRQGIDPRARRSVRGRSRAPGPSGGRRRSAHVPRAPHQAAPGAAHRAKRRSEPCHPGAGHAPHGRADAARASTSTVPTSHLPEVDDRVLVVRAPVPLHRMAGHSVRSLRNFGIIDPCPFSAIPRSVSEARSWPP